MSVTEKTIQVHLTNTHDTETNWQGVESTFTPADGEFIIYSAGGDNSADGSAGVSGGKQTTSSIFVLCGWTLILAGDDDDVAYIYT